MKVADMLETVIGILLAVSIGILVVYLIGDIKSIITNHSDLEVFNNYLAAAFNLVIGIEFIKMLCKHTPETVIEVLLFAIARQLIVEHTTTMENLVGIISIGILFATRKYLFYKKCKDFNPYEMSLLNDNLMSKWNINKILEKNNLFIFPQKYFDWDEERKMIISPITLSHVSEYETKVSLKTGLLKRDPTRDIRLIELILSYPIDQFVRDGQQRYLVKRAMKGLIPDEFIEGRISRGIQAADWIERLRDKWDVVYPDMLKMKGNKTIEYFCDNNKINYYIDKYKSLPVEYTDEIKYEIRSFISIYIFYKFISDFNNII